ncbi:MAG: DUF523 domain-containing protein [Eubacteriales bacterium]|nr:DUF523 domain-containing protein [Eubacteriales bacterium]
MDKGPIILKEKPLIGISSCCFGCAVRYNGRSMDMVKGIGREKGDFRWVPVCPENAAGLGVPRDPIHLVGENGRSVWHQDGRVVSRGGKDVTDALKAGALESLATLARANIKVFIYMDGSPSCGVYRTTLKKQNRGKPPGIFGALLDEAGYFLIPALDLQSPIKWWDWRRRMLAFLWLQAVPLTTRAELYDVWYRLKFLCQELDNPWAREQGRYLASLTGPLDPEIATNFRRQVSDLLRRPSTLKRITGSLWKNYCHHRKVTGRPVADINEPTALRNITAIARELIVMERESAKEGILFGTSPVLYSGRS